MSNVGRSHYSLGFKAAGASKPGVQRVAEQLRAVGYNDRDLHAVATSIAQADAGDYVSREEQYAISRMMIEKGRFVSREEYLASVAPQPKS